MGAGGTDLGPAFGLLLVNQLELRLGGEVVHGLDPADDFSKAQGLLNAGARNALCVSRQTFAKSILYLGNKIGGRHQTPLHNLLLALFNHVPEVPTFDILPSHGTFDYPPKRRNVTFVLVAKSQVTH